MKARGRRVEARAAARRFANTRRAVAEKVRREARHQAKIKNAEEMARDQ